MKDNKTRFYGLLLILAAAVYLAGCRTIEESKESQNRDMRLELYAKTVRWGALENLYGFLTPEESAKAALPDNLNDIRVTGYQVRVPPMMLEKHKLSQTVVIEYLFHDTQVLKTMSDNQIWEYDPELESWFRANPVPEFK